MPIAILLLALALPYAVPSAFLPSTPAPAALQATAPVAFPDTPAGICARAWLSALNTPAERRDEAVRAFELAHRAPARLAETPVEERVARARSLVAEFGAIEALSAREENPRHLVAEARAVRKGTIQLDFEFDAAGKLETIRIASESNGPGHSQPVDGAARAAIVAAVGKAMAEEYVFPDKGQAMAQRILAAAAAGDYDAIADEAALARRLTDDLRSVSNDKHLRVRVMPDAGSPAGDSPMAGMMAEAKRNNWFFRSAEVADGNIGILRFDRFIPEEEAMRVADSAYAFLGRCDALVFDLRHNGGGSPEMITYLTSYLFDEPTLLNRMVDRDGKVVGEATTSATVAGQRFPKDLPVYVLTSSETFSGAEEFAYNLQNLKRATIVGETTGGGAHPVKAVRLDGRFVVMMPFLRAENPITKTNWEGSGVHPDVAVPASQALDKALELARAKLGR